VEKYQRARKAKDDNMTHAKTLGLLVGDVP